MVSINSSVKLTSRNTATLFEVRVTTTPLDLTYSQLTLATGTVVRNFIISIQINLGLLNNFDLGFHIAKFYQSRKSQRSIIVTLLQLYTDRPLSLAT
ncbi:hypothetical protein K1719_017766 [Acacia pycnantha]|nr:hypothetical protein K1719_017766 [Acacia pycnantha]